MNIILLTEDDFVTPGRVILSDRRLHHIRTVLKPDPGQLLNVGIVNGKLGRGRLLQIDPNAVELEVRFEQDPPLPADISLLLALPRPKVLRRILQSVTALGIKKIILLNSYRVEKSYWQSPLLAPDIIRKQLLLGLEQAGDTLLPEVFLRKRFKPFVEDELPQLAAGCCCLMADPAAGTPCPLNPSGPICLAVGPEGGYILYEVEKLRAAGFRSVRLGARIMKVETAVAALVGRLSHA